MTGLVVLLLAAAAPNTAAAQASQFGVRGLGLPGRALSARSLATGGGFGLFDGESSLNPAALAGLGVGRGDRVALVMPNCPQYVIAYYATMRLGAIVVGNNPLYTKREMELQLRDSGAKVAIVLDLLHHDFADVFKMVGLEPVGRAGDVPHRPVPQVEEMPRRGHRAPELVDGDHRERIVRPALDGDQDSGQGRACSRIHDDAANCG